MTRTGKTLRMVVCAALFVAAALVLAGNTLAVERAGYSMEILIDGAPTCEFAARGTHYIEAMRGREYSVRLHNQTGERIAIALSVDGLNTIDARTTTAKDARKWVLGPYETITLDGWQVSSMTSRNFFFTTEQKSYGSWLGKTNNLGVIAAAVFREKRPPISIYHDPCDGTRCRQREGGRSDSKEKSSGDRPAPSAPSGQSQGTPALEKDESSLSSPESQRSDVQQKKSDEYAATGIGDEASHPVQQVFFDTEETPAAVLELRYEYHDSLVRLGVLPANPYSDSLSRREGAQGFVEPGFAPDPYRRGNR